MQFGSLGPLLALRPHPWQNQPHWAQASHHLWTLILLQPSSSAFFLNQLLSSLDIWLTGVQCKPTQPSPQGHPALAMPNTFLAFPFTHIVQVQDHTLLCNECADFAVKNPPPSPPFKRVWHSEVERSVKLFTKARNFTWEILERLNERVGPHRLMKPGFIRKMGGKSLSMKFAPLYHLLWWQLESESWSKG